VRASGVAAAEAARVRIEASAYGSIADVIEALSQQEHSSSLISANRITLWLRLSPAVGTV
jgi:hypothetical protein